MKRRTFITLLGGAAGMTVARPFVAHAQQPARVARIGYVSGTGRAADPGPFVEALQQGMREHGYIEGKDFIIDYRGAEGRPARVPELVAELVQAKVDVLVAPTPPAIRAAKEATDSISIVMVTRIDPVAAGIIDSLAKPGGNITGISMLTRDLSGKRLEFLKDVRPRLARVAILLDAGEPLAVAGYATYEAPARALQIELRSLEVRAPNPDLDAAIKAALEWHADALVVVSSTLLFPYRKAIADLALKWRLPDGVSRKRLGRGWRPHVVFRRRSRGVPPGSLLHRSDPQGGQAARSSGGTADEVPAGDQSENGKSARRFCSVGAARLCR
jgi:ABC-type uncharacterized transport system substrate-binding protein